MEIVKFIITVIVLFLAMIWAATTIGANIYLRRNKK